MSWCWLAMVDRRPADCLGAAPISERGRAAGMLAAWPRGRKPVRDARRADVRIVDQHGPPAWISLVLPPAGSRLRFDDLAVQQARRDLLAGPWPRAASALMRDASHFEGAIVVARDGEQHRLADDPFGRLFPARVLRVAAGLLGSVPPPVGPAIERYGSANPWPADRFD